MQSITKQFSTLFLLMMGLILFSYSPISAAALASVPPNLVGMKEAAAKSAIEGTCGFTPAQPGPPAVEAGDPVCLKALVTYAFSTTVAPGIVISQSPTTGNVPPVTTVTIVVSNALTVPDVLGETEQAAKLTIETTCVSGNAALCLKANVSSIPEASETVPKGRVIRQDPAANFKAPAGSTVNLVISSGPALLKVPNTVGKPQLDAEIAIKNTCVVGSTTQCLKVGPITFQTSETVAPGSVIRQDPPAEASVGLGTAVNLVISSGRNPTTVPSVVGLPLAAAKTAIEGTCSPAPAVCLKVGAVTLATSSAVPAGSVIGQNPAGGSQVAPGTTVNLVISSGVEAPINPPVAAGDIEVPNVKGLAKTVAATLIHNAGLSVGAIREQHSDTVPTGAVIDQSPAAGAKVASGTPVSLTISLGKAGVVKIPDVRGMPEELAITTLRNVGLAIDNTLHQPDPTVPMGQAIGTEPAAGAEVKIGSAVTLIISDGFSQPQQVEVPDVTHHTVEDAKEILFAVGLFRVGAVTLRSSTTVPAGKVSGMSPSAGTPVAYGTTINLFVSSGSTPPVTAPNVVSLTLAEATAKINSAGLKLGFVSRQTSNTVEEGRVISQNPLMTALVPAGWEIDLVVSLGPVPQDPGARPQTQVPDVAGLGLAAATAKLVEAGLRVGLVSNERSAVVPAGQVLRQNPPSAATIPVSGKVNLVISFGPHAYSLFSQPAYITNYVGGTVSILNQDLNQLADNIPSSIDNNSAGPSGIVVSPDGTRLYVANRPRFGRTNGSVSVIDLTERKVIAVIPVGLAPLGIALNPTGERLFVANEGSFSLSVIDTASNQPFVDLNVPNLRANPYPRGVATHPNPLRPLVYVSNRTVNSFSDDNANPYVDQCDALVARPPVNVNHDQCVGSLSIFDADLKMQVGSVAVGWAPEGVAVHPDGGFVYVANSGDRTVSVVETVFNQVVGIITLDEFGGAPQPLVPRGVAVSPDGNRLYVTDGAGNRLFVIDTTANHAVVGIVPVGKKPYGVSVSPDSKRVYVANTDGNTVSVVDGRSNQVITTIPVGLGPWAFGQFMGPLATVSPPVFNPASGVYQAGLAVTITSPVAGASIRYTTDGSLPTPTSGNPINNGQPIVLTWPINQVIFIRAIAFKEGWAESSVAEASYLLRR